MLLCCVHVWLDCVFLWRRIWEDGDRTAGWFFKNL